MDSGLLSPVINRRSSSDQFPPYVPNTSAKDDQQRWNGSTIHANDSHLPVSQEQFLHYMRDTHGRAVNEDTVVHINHQTTATFAMYPADKSTRCAACR
jgi:hypothetical protein